ncbi:unnamed protein product [Polarella glacialis]|uniref:EF-hand domain-containing protein n=1 Tax=Polarella glacialis TaxID=89957 RepID=A0A813IMD4_POLGL|nr:unnamed protein product [Polarella glacialis]CAE8651647.1 unnamed protein product [Polarella glacialis]
MMSSMTSPQGLGSTAFLAVGGTPRTAALRGTQSAPSSEFRSRSAGSSSGGPQVASHDTPANWTAMTASLAMAASLAVGRKEKRRFATRASFVRLKATDTDADVDLVTQLQLEASKLRSEVSGLEAEREEQLQRDRLALFHSFDLDRSGSISVQELRTGLQEMGLELDEPKAEGILRALDKDGDGMLTLEEFDLKAATKQIEEWRAQDEAVEDATRAAAQALERQSKEVESEKQANQEYIASLPPSNDDVGLPTRLASVLAYLLPCMDVLRYGLPLALMFPSLQGPFSALFAISGVFQAFPFGLGYLALFIGMQNLAKNTELPTLLRFNLRQSVILDIALFVPGILSGVISLAADAAKAPISEELAFAGNGIVFALLVACVAYSTGSSLLGVAPRGLPFISEMAGEAISDTRPNDDASSSKP